MKQVQEGFINYESNRWQFNLINNYYYPKQFGCDCDWSPVAFPMNNDI